MYFQTSDDDDGDHVDDGKQLGLWEVEERVLKSSGDVAKACLAELGFETLAVNEARKVLARRIELGS